MLSKGQIWKKADNRNGIEYFVTNKHAQAERLYRRLIGRKACAELKRTKTRSLVKIYN